MPPITARIPDFWDPREVLGINPAESHFSCTAIVIPKKKRGQPQEPPRRCLQTFLSNECKDQACRILDTLAHVDVVLVGLSEGIKRALVHVAELTACPRFHKEPRRSQAEAVGSKWTDLVGQFIVHERASRRRAEREGLRFLAVAEPRAASHNHSHRNRVPSAPNNMDPRMREAPERGARRPREDHQQGPEVPAQYRPREQQQDQVLLQGQNAGRGDIHDPRQVQVNPGQQQPVQDLDAPMPRQAIPQEDASFADLPVRRGNPQSQAEVESAPNQDQFVDRNRAQRSYLAQPGPIPHAGLENRLEPGPLSLSPGGVLGGIRTRALSDRLPIEAVANPMDDGEVDDLELLVQQLGLLREQADRGELEPHQPAPRAPEVPFHHIQNREREPEMARIERVQPLTPHQQRHRVVQARAPDRPYVPVRKPLVDCYICFEPFDRADDVVWCQGQCGHNVHRECFETWQLHSGYAGRNCGYCRAPWVEN